MPVIFAEKSEWSEPEFPEKERLGKNDLEKGRPGKRTNSRKRFLIE